MTFDLQLIERLRTEVDALCEQLDEEYVKMLEQDDDFNVKKSLALRRCLTSLKDARSNLDRAIGTFDD